MSEIFRRRNTRAAFPVHEVDTGPPCHNTEQNNHVLLLGHKERVAQFYYSDKFTMDLGANVAAEPGQGPMKCAHTE